ncbi:cytochrome c oxidase subunit II [Rhizobium deserti]|uniref:Cytochrome aa3 subunit 2 n=1 Tax=Rhizobium deserti TaxID=2547961 RepID=A0A4R5UP90_9HYPH|nr:cytochrome c oxidase subunit II [Rhizobium deserti]TDK39594.1 cytochrome c oxidase subunit II [Rhizobium deserti]
MTDDRLTGSECWPIRSRLFIGRITDRADARSFYRAGLMLAASLLCSCSGPQSALDPAGPEAEDVAILFFTMVVGGALIWCSVVGILFYASRKKHAYDAGQASRIILWCGVVFPTIVLGALLSYAVWLMPNIRPGFGEANARLRTIDVAGEQFWWRVRYQNAEGSAAFETANEVRVPVGERVLFKLTSPDVIHSFWIPVLGGKMDVIPGRENHLTLMAEKPGTYRGVCAEFCGPSHAFMAFTVVAMEPGAFEDWTKARASFDGARDAEGLALFLKHGCSACHAISGTEARGTIGPDLSGFGERGSVGVGALVNTQEDIARFIRNPSEIKPGARMPHFSMLPETDIQRIAAYLKGLQ